MLTNKETIWKGNTFQIDEESGVKFRLRYRDWNDYGYYTLYTLEMQLPNTWLSYTISDIRIMNIGQKNGEKPDASSNSVVFISNVASAEKLFLMLTPQQRLKLEKTLQVQYDASSVKNEPAFLKSVCRDRTVQKFVEAQNRIKMLMHSEIDVRTILDNHNEQICLLLSSLTKQS